MYQVFCLYDSSHTFIDYNTFLLPKELIIFKSKLFIELYKIKILYNLRMSYNLQL